MKRDMYKTVAEIQGKVPNGYSLSYSECVALAKKL